MIPSPSHYEDLDPDHSSSWGKIEYQTETTPRLYLDFAIEDLESDKTGRAFVNSLSNAKRALHLQIETLSNAFGFRVAVSKKNPNFYDYLGFCEKCGVVTPRILRRLNSIRNSVEHDYYIPTEREVEDFVDVVELFLAATDRYFYQFPLDFEFLPLKKKEEDLPEIFSVELKPFGGEVLLLVRRSRKERCEDWDSFVERNSIKILASEDVYFDWLNLLIKKVHKG